MKAVVFNGSGMLIDSDLSGLRLLLVKFGKEKEMLEQKRNYDKLKGSGPWGLENLARLFEGLTEKEINEKSKEIVEQNLREEAREAIIKLKENGFKVVCYSSELINVLNIMKGMLGLDEVYGNSLDFDKGVATGKLKEKVDRYNRVKKIEELMQNNNLNKKDVFIVGDSITSVPSAQFGTLIAMNSKDEQLRQVAKFRISNLRDLFSLIKSFLIFIYISFFGGVVRSTFLKSGLLYH